VIGFPPHNYNLKIVTLIIVDSAVGVGLGNKKFCFTLMRNFNTEKCTLFWLATFEWYQSVGTRNWSNTFSELKQGY